MFPFIWFKSLLLNSIYWCCCCCSANWFLIYRSWEFEDVEMEPKHSNYEMPFHLILTIFISQNPTNAAHGRQVRSIANVRRDQSISYFPCEDTRICSFQTSDILNYLQIYWIKNFLSWKLFTFGVVTLGLDPPIVPGMIVPFSENRVNIFDTQPWLIFNWREMSPEGNDFIWTEDKNITHMDGFLVLPTRQFYISSQLEVVSHSQKLLRVDWSPQF